MESSTFNLDVNGEPKAVTARGETPLIYVLRNDLGLKGTRFGCGSGDCGSCMVLLDGVAEKSCQTPVESVGDRRIETVEILANGTDLSPLQQAILDEQAGQCGYCLSGIIIAGTALLRSCASASELDVRAVLDGNLCRCGSHDRIVRAVLRAAGTENDHE
jgi:nicotinate dehydrogenase subunit A